jgi:hypothetical protein
MKQETAPACKVVTQYHSAGEMVYELASPNALLDVRVSSRAAGRAGERSWHVAAQQGRSPDSVVIGESAATKAEALGLVAELWAQREQELGLPAFDWKAVTAALLAVRAI